MTKETLINSISTQGFTLIETMIVLVIVVGVILVLSVFGLDVSNFGVFLGNNLEVIQEIQKTFQIAIYEIQSAQFSNQGAYPIAQVGQNSVTFYTDVGNDNLVDQIRYFLDTGSHVFKRGIIVPSGSPLKYEPASEIMTDLIHNVVLSTSGIFTYYDKDHTGFEDPMLYPIKISDIRLIKLKITADQDENSEPGPITNEIIIDIRNLRSNI